MVDGNGFPDYTPKFPTFQDYMQYLRDEDARVAEAGGGVENKYTYIGGNTTNAKQENTIQDIWDNSITNSQDFNLSCGAMKVYSGDPEDSEKFNTKSLEIAKNKNEIRRPKISSPRVGKLFFEKTFMF